MSDDELARVDALGSRIEVADRTVLVDQGDVDGIFGGSPEFNGGAMSAISSRRRR